MGALLTEGQSETAARESCLTWPPAGTAGPGSYTEPNLTPALLHLAMTWPEAPATARLHLAGRNRGLLYSYCERASLLFFTLVQKKNQHRRKTYIMVARGWSSHGV